MASLPPGHEVGEADGLIDGLGGRDVGKPGEVGDGERGQAVVELGVGHARGLVRDDDASHRGRIGVGVGKEVPGLGTGAIPVDGGVVGQAAVADDVARVDRVAVAHGGSAQG